MANIQSAKKRARQNDKLRVHNAALRSRLRTAVRHVLRAVAAGDQEAAQSSYRAAVPQIDKMASKGIIAKNKAARYKSRLNAKVRALQEPAPQE